MLEFSDSTRESDCIGNIGVLFNEESYVTRVDVNTHDNLVKGMLKLNIGRKNDPETSDEKSLNSSLSIEILKYLNLVSERLDRRVIPNLFSRQNLSPMSNMLVYMVGNHHLRSTYDFEVVLKRKSEEKDMCWNMELLNHLGGKGTVENAIFELKEQGTFKGLKRKVQSKDRYQAKKYIKVDLLGDMINQINLNDGVTVKVAPEVSNLDHGTPFRAVKVVIDNKKMARNKIVSPKSRTSIKNIVRKCIFTGIKTESSQSNTSEEKYGQEEVQGLGHKNVRHTPLKSAGQENKVMQKSSDKSMQALQESGQCQRDKNLHKRDIESMHLLSVKSQCQVDKNMLESSGEKLKKMKNVGGLRLDGYPTLEMKPIKVNGQNSSRRISTPGRKVRQKSTCNSLAQGKESIRGYFIEKPKNESIGESPDGVVNRRKVLMEEKFKNGGTEPEYGLKNQLNSQF